MDFSMLYAKHFFKLLRIYTRYFFFTRQYLILLFNLFLIQLAEDCGAHYGVSIKVVQNSVRGYYFLVPSTLDPLPAVFTQPVLNRRSIACSTAELSSLSDRATEAIGSALSITNELIQTLLGRIRSAIHCLFSLTDSVVILPISYLIFMLKLFSQALIDMLSSFAEVVSNSPHPFVRPNISNEGPLVIKAGRHPVISSISSQQLCSSFVSNDTFLGEIANMQVITGPNGSGKVK
jgi:DNA mismatch repair protein MSH4